jgi:hypothetical protein
VVRNETRTNRPVSRTSELHLKAKVASSTAAKEKSFSISLPPSQFRANFSLDYADRRTLASLTSPAFHLLDDYCNATSSKDRITSLPCPLLFVAPSRKPSGNDISQTFPSPTPLKLLSPVVAHDRGSIVYVQSAGRLRHFSEHRASEFQDLRVRSLTRLVLSTGNR